MQKKLLVIAGPTATGKTRLALHLARKFGCDIISADSRQIYKDMTVGTGKDIPPGFKFRDEGLGFYTDGKVKIWGYDLVGPKAEFSVSHYLKFARKVFKNTYQKNDLLILVGGTGLYLQAVLSGIETSAVPRNKVLRAKLVDLSVSQAFEMLAHLDPVKAANMNASDKHNKRRIVRAIEIASFKGKFKSSKTLVNDKDVLTIGLWAERQRLYDQIEKRVDKRLMSRIEPEIDRLLRSGITWNHQAMSALGYSQWKGYYTGDKTISDVEESWKAAERRYAKRQISWFNKIEAVWFDISESGFEKKVERLVEKWYKKVSYASQKN